MSLLQVKGVWFCGNSRPPPSPHHLSPRRPPPQEEKEWAELLSKVETLEVNPPEAEPADAEPSTSQVAEDLARIQAFEADAARRLIFQVDGVCLVVGEMEDLVDRAHETAQEAQIKVHNERFKAFPHMNSPAKLIRALVRPPVKAPDAAGE